MAKRASQQISAPASGRLVTASGRVLMEPIRGSKLSADAIDRAIAKVKDGRSALGSQTDKRKKA